MRPHSSRLRPQLYEAEARCNEAKAEVVIFGLEAETISKT